MVQLDKDSIELLSALIMTKSFPAAIRRVREHRALGHRTVLITGALDFVVKPLAPLFDEIIAAEMTTKADGTYTGELTAVPPTGETRAQIMADYCEAVGGRLEERGLCRLHVGPADAGGRRLPGGREPRDPPRRDRPQAGVAGRAVVEAPGGPPLLPIGPLLSARERRASARSGR